MELTESSGWILTGLDAASCVAALVAADAARGERVDTGSSSSLGACEADSSLCGGVRRSAAWLADPSTTLGAGPSGRRGVFVPEPIAIAKGTNQLP